MTRGRHPGCGKRILALHAKFGEAVHPHFAAFCSLCSLIQLGETEPMTFWLALSATLSLGCGVAEAEEGFEPLFDGSSIDRWTLVNGRGPGYVIEDGILVCPADGGGNLFTKETFANFDFRFDFKLSPGGNNGVGIRAPMEGDAAYVGMEIQLLDDAAPQYAKLKPVQYCGSIYGVVASRRGALKPAGEWNSMQIRCDGRKVQVVLNDETIVDANLDDVKDEAVLKSHPGLSRADGHIGFLGHGTRVEFKNVRVKRL